MFHNPAIATTSTAHSMRARSSTDRPRRSVLEVLEMHQPGEKRARFFTTEGVGGR